MSGPGVGTKHVLTLRDVLPRLVSHRLCGARLKGRAGRPRSSGTAAQSAWQPTVKACILDAMGGNCRLLLTSLGSSGRRKVFIADRGNDMEKHTGLLGYRIGLALPHLEPLLLLMCDEHAYLSNPAAYVHVKQWAALWQQASASYSTTFA